MRLTAWLQPAPEASKLPFSTNSTQFTGIACRSATGCSASFCSAAGCWTTTALAVAVGAREMGDGEAKGDGVADGNGVADGEGVSDDEGMPVFVAVTVGVGVAPSDTGALNASPGAIEPELEVVLVVVTVPRPTCRDTPGPKN